MNQIIFNILFLLLFSSCHHIQVNKKKDASTTEIVDFFEAQINCGKTKEDKSGMIFIFDTIKSDSIHGLAIFDVIFDNIDSLNIDSVVLRMILIMEPMKTRYSKDDKEFNYYNTTLTPIFENYIFWKNEDDVNSIFLNRRRFNIPFIIYQRSSEAGKE